MAQSNHTPTLTEKQRLLSPGTRDECHTSPPHYPNDRVVCLIIWAKPDEPQVFLDTEFARGVLFDGRA